jgi:hypothetical protein
VNGTGMLGDLWRLSPLHFRLNRSERRDRRERQPVLQDKHLRTVVAHGDEAHKDALAQMKERWKHSIMGMGWYRNVRRDFTALPDD